MQASHDALMDKDREELRRELVVLARMLHSEVAEVSASASSRIKDMVLASNPAQVCALSSPGSMRAAGRMRSMPDALTNACSLRRKQTRTSSPASTALLKAL